MDFMSMTLGWESDSVDELVVEKKLFLKNLL